MGYVCRCFYEKNIYLKQYNLHATYTGNEAEFKSCYAEFLLNQNCSEQEINNVLSLVKKEITRRKELHENSVDRKKYILKHYKRLHPELFVFKESFLNPQLIQIANYTKSNLASLSRLLAFPTMRKHTASQVYTFPVFTRTFCQSLVEELEAFNVSDVPKGRPNTMNNYGVLLDEVGFDETFLNPFLMEYIYPLAKLLYPECGGGSLDSYKAFTVKYKIGEDLNLGYHFDNAEVTLNVCLGKNFTEGNLYFGDMKEVPVADSECREFAHKVGYGCLHRGQHMHGALPIHSGERHNMIIWMRSSQIRNGCCPMCNRKPDIIEVAGKGDGFTVKTVSVCSTS